MRRARCAERRWHLSRRSGWWISPISVKVPLLLRLCDDPQAPKEGAGEG